MSLNWLEINEILRELDLPGSYVQQIRQPDYSSLVLDLYRPGGAFSLYISLSGAASRLHSLSRKIPNPKKQPRFSEFLRARIKGGKISEAEQIGNERIIRLPVIRGDTTTILWIRLWGGAANILATDESFHILETFFRRPARNETAGHLFSPPVAMEKPAGNNGTDTKYSLRAFPGEGSYNSRVEAYYHSFEMKKRNEVLEKQARQLLSQRENRIISTITRLRERLDSFSRFDTYKQAGDLILSNLHKIKKGDAWISVEDYYNEGQIRDIELDPELDPRENAEKYFKKYHKSKSGLALTHEEIVNYENRLSRLRLLSDRVDTGEGLQEAVDLLKEDQKESNREERDERPGLSFRSDNFTILVGRTGKENDILLRKFVRGNDMWLHVRDYPGAYVFIKHKPGKSVPLDVLLDAGNLALFYSKGRTSGQADLYYTFVKYLRRAKDGKPGLVLPTQEKNLHVRLDEQRLEKLQNG